MTASAFLVIVFYVGNLLGVAAQVDTLAECAEVARKLRTHPDPDVRERIESIECVARGPKT